MSEFTKPFFANLDRYINKYYRCLLIDGVVICSVFFSLSFLAFSLIEYAFHFSSSFRLVLLIIFLSSNIYLFIRKIALNLLKLFSFINRLSYKDACRKIQSYNTEFQDLLINILQLSRIENNILADAAIKQKLEKLETAEFAELFVYNWKSKISSILLQVLTFLGVLIVFPNLYYKGFKNIVHYSSENTPKHQFNVLINNNLLIEKGSDLSINANVFSDMQIDQLFICFGNNRFPMQQVGDSTFCFTLKNINNTFSFTLETEELKSKSFSISVYDSPVLLDYQVAIDYQNYVNKADTIVYNQNILNVPQGTILNFAFTGRYFDTLSVRQLSDSSQFKFCAADTVFYEKKILKDEKFEVILSNEYSSKDLISFKIISIPDNYPEIKVSKLDGLSGYDLVFDGNITDDYGFSKLLFCLEDESKRDTIHVPFYNNLTSQRLFYTFQKPSTSNLDDKVLTCHFEVYDNDAVHGPKKTVSETFSYVVKSIINQAADKEVEYEQMFNKLEMSKILSEEIKNDINELRRKSIENNLSDWEKQNLLQQIKSKTNSLENLLEEITKSQNQISNNDSFDSELVEKQNKISEMLNSLVDEELKQMLEEITNLANEKKQDVTPENLRKNFDDFKKSLDRNLELLKKVKLEEDLAKLSDNLEFLSQNQKELLNNINEQADENISLQQSVFENLSQQYDQIKNDNSQLDKPLQIDDLKNEFDNIKSNFEKENNYLENKDFDSFMKETEKNANELSELSNKIKQNMQNSASDQEAENAEDLRQILDNLFELSFRQENIILKYDRVDFNNSVYLEQIVEQSELVENFKLIRDSLYSLSKRTIYIGAYLSKVTFLIEDNMIKSSTYFQERSSSRAVLSQREALTKMNDLILLLSESLKDMDNASGSAGGKSIKNKKHKPKKDEESLSEMRSAQESMKNQLRDLLNQMKSGDSEEINKQIAKSLMQNEIYQQMIQQMYNNSEIDDGISKLLREVKELMEKNHSDLANKKLSIQTVMRQQNIVSKLLQAESAENERETEEKRIATTGKNINRNKTEIPIEDIKFEKNIDFLKQDNLRLNSFYKVIFDKYINGVSNNE